MSENTLTKDARSILNTAGTKALFDAAQDVVAIEPKAEPPRDAKPEPAMSNLPSGTAPIPKVDGEGRPAPVVYYDGRKYLWETPRDYIPMDRQSVMAQLNRRKIDATEEICRIQLENYVKYAGPLAGKRRGIVESNGDKLLATTDPIIVEAEDVPWPTTRDFLVRLLCDEGHGNRQLIHFMGWIKYARQALHEGVRRPAQALVMAGPIQSGKTTAIRLAKIALGGRQAMPYKYLTGKTGFNADLVGSELLVIDDDTGTTDIRSRRALGDGIKNKLFADAVRIEGKGSNAFTFDPLWRLMIACNNEPENLLVLPPLNHDLADKLMLLHCQPAVTCRGDAEWKAFTAAIEAELPGFLHACEKMDIPENMRDSRCGIGAFQHPLLVDALGELSPEHQLLQLVDQLAAGGEITWPWEGTAAQLKQVLTARDASTARDAERLLGSWLAAAGVYLGRLVGGRVEKLLLHDGHQRWRIEP